MADLEPVNREARNQAPHEFDRVAVDRRRRQAIANHDRKLAWTGELACKQMF